MDWTIPLTAHKLRVTRDPQLNHREVFTAQRSKRFEVPFSVTPEPVTFEHFHTDELLFKITYASGILGSVTLQERISFIARRQ